MTIFSFSIPTRIQFGVGVSLQAGGEARRLAASGKSGDKLPILVVNDPGIQNAPWLRNILDGLTDVELQPVLFNDVRPNPKDNGVYAAASIIKREQIRVVLAIGGGSAIDTAKGAALIAAHGGEVRDYAGWQKVPGPVIPVIAIPTTAGSGSEATCWAVITGTNSHAKLAIGDRYLAPAVALVDPALTTSLPPALTAATGMDALTHSIEAYLCTLSNPVNDLLALESIRLVAGNLLQAYQQGDNLHAREAMSLASTLGGVAINNADVAGVHCLSESMGSLYDAPHGLLNAILLPYFLAYWLPGCRERFVQLAQAFGLPPDARGVVSQVVGLNRAFILPGLEEVGIKSADIPALARLAEANVSNPSNPLPMTASDYLDILKRALAGKPPGL